MGIEQIQPPKEALLPAFSVQLESNGVRSEPNLFWCMLQAMFKNVSEPHHKGKTFRCPCCGFKTLHGRAGFELCPVCWWEDDGQDDHDANDVRGGPNGVLSLAQARLNFVSCGACDAKFSARVRQPLEDEQKPKS